MTESTYTLEQAKQILARSKCEEGVSASRYSRGNCHPLGHSLKKVLDGHTRALAYYRCESCGAKFYEAAE